MKKAGILLPVFSLPGKYGIGTLGQNAIDFIDLLCDTGNSIWQILPMGPTGFGDSPYQSFSAFAGNPYFIDLETLVSDGLLDEKDLAAIDFGKDPKHVDYGKQYTGKRKPCFSPIKPTRRRMTRLHFFQRLNRRSGNTVSIWPSRIVKTAQIGGTGRISFGIMTRTPSVIFQTSMRTKSAFMPSYRHCLRSSGIKSTATQQRAASRFSAISRFTARSIPRTSGRTGRFSSSIPRAIPQR